MKHWRLRIVAVVVCILVANVLYVAIKTLRPQSLTVDKQVSTQQISDTCLPLTMTVVPIPVVIGIDQRDERVLSITAENPSPKNQKDPDRCAAFLEELQVSLSSNVVLNNTPIVLSAIEDGQMNVLSRVDAQAFPVTLRLSLKSLALSSGEKKTIFVYLQLPGAKNFDGKKVTLTLLTDGLRVKRANGDAETLPKEPITPEPIVLTERVYE